MSKPSNYVPIPTATPAPVTMANPGPASVARSGTASTAVMTEINLQDEIVLDKIVLEKNSVFGKKGYFCVVTKESLSKNMGVDVQETLIFAQAESSAFIIISKKFPEIELTAFLELLSKNNRLTALKYTSDKNDSYPSYLIFGPNTKCNIIFTTCYNTLSSLRQLKIGPNWISKKDLKELLLLLKRSSALIDLEVGRPSDCRSIETTKGNETYDMYFAEFLRNNTTLLSLTIRGFLHNAQNTAKVLLENKTLKFFAINELIISHDTIKEFSKILTHNDTMESLCLHYIEDSESEEVVLNLNDDIGDVSLNFAQALLNNRILTSCTYDGSTVTVKGAEMFARVLAENNVLNALDFGEDAPTSKKIRNNAEIFTIIANALPKNQSLGILVINDAITPNGVIAFKESMRLNTNLFRLVIRQRNDDDNVADKYINSEQAQKLDSELDVFIKRNCLLKANWWRVALLMRFRKANANHRFIDSIFPLFEEIAKLFEKDELNLQRNNSVLDRKQLYQFVSTTYSKNLSALQTVSNSDTARAKDKRKLC